MYRKEVNAQSPLRILERSIHGGLGAGNLGVVMARAGVGKTAFLVQVGLDDIMRERDVLHVALGQSLEHVQSWYDGLFDDLAKDVKLDNREQVRASTSRRRVIQAYADTTVSPKQVEDLVKLYTQHLEHQPKAILIDGYEWSDDVVSQAADIGAFKALARRLGAELWLTAQTHRSTSGDHPTDICPPYDTYKKLIDVAVFLEPHEHHVRVRLLKDHDNPDVQQTHLELEPDTMQLVTDAEASPTRLPARAYTLLSGANKGAEAAFGACAEEWGLEEMNFTFAGRSTERQRGLVVLSEQELKQGEASPAYIEAHLHRKFPKTPQFSKMLQTIWHQVATSGQVFVVGLIQDDGTVKGGTGWAAELAKHFNKPLFVFDQEKNAWCAWKNGAWEEGVEPTIERTRFTGTGTRFLSDQGLEAVRALFARSFKREA
ncbi:MAG: hypothetical protein RIT81_40990 [Deltaproteobacteria bacterium]